jgi:hypothetical protein
MASGNDPIPLARGERRLLADECPCLYGEVKRA